MELKGFITIRWLKDVELIVTESYDEENDITHETTEAWKKGETVEFDILEDRKTTIDVQFGDGSVCYNICKGLFEVIEIEK